MCVCVCVCVCVCHCMISYFALNVEITEFVWLMSVVALWTPFWHCCKSWSAQALKLLGNVHVPKHVYTSNLQEVAKQYIVLVYKECPSLYTCCAQIWHWLGHMYISKQFPSLGTPNSIAVWVSNFYDKTHHSEGQGTSCDGIEISRCQVSRNYLGLQKLDVTPTVKELYVHIYTQNGSSCC